MFFPPDLGPEFMRLVKPIWESEDSDATKLRLVWGMLAALQGIVLGHMLVRRLGERVFAGPFRGMRLVPEMMDRPFAPALLGSYEWEIHGAVEEAVAKPYKQVLNVGCSYGYYAVGLALRMPDATVHAFDSDPKARAQCRKMAHANDVQDRVVILEKFGESDWSRLAGPETLVVADMEGEEETALDPHKNPSLLSMDVIVRIYDAVKRSLSTTLPLRYAETHDVKVVPNAPFHFPLEKILGPDYVPDHFDSLIATWEGRVGAAPFGVFTRKPAEKQEQK